jgi:hypothetical protein
MSAPVTIPAGEIGVLRLFALDMPREQVRFLRDEPGAIDDVLGTAGLNPEDVEIFPVSDLDDLGLPGYLHEGHAVPEDQIAPTRARLDAQTGFVMVLHSRAFGGRATTLTPARSLIPLGTYSATPTDWTARPQPAPASARPHSGPPASPRANRARARTIGASIFAVVMAVVALLLWLILA